MLRLVRAYFSGSADLIDCNNEQTLEIVKEAVQRSPYFQRQLKINLMSSLMEECPKKYRFAMRKHYRRGVKRFFYQLFEVELPESQDKTNS